jgi:hypothetical protein
MPHPSTSEEAQVLSLVDCTQCRPNCELGPAVVHLSEKEWLAELQKIAGAYDSETLLHRTNPFAGPGTALIGQRPYAVLIPILGPYVTFWHRILR